MSRLNSPGWFLSTSLRELLQSKVASLVCPALTKSGRPSLRDQLERAAASIALNLAEGNARRTRPDRRHFFAIAQGSAMECAAAVDILRVTSAITLAEATRAKHKPTRIVQMLVGLRRRDLLPPQRSGRLGG
jgi:four helix bundle protein